LNSQRCQLAISQSEPAWLLLLLLLVLEAELNQYLDDHMGLLIISPTYTRHSDQ